MKFSITLDMYKTEFYPGKTVYYLNFEIPRQKTQQFSLTKDDIQNKIICGKEVPPHLTQILVQFVRDYLSKLYIQSDY